MNRDRVIKNISLLTLTALGIGAAIYFIRKDKRDLLKSKYYTPNPSPDVDNGSETEPESKEESRSDDSTETDSVVKEVRKSPEDRYNSLANRLIENNFFGGEDIRFKESEISEVLSSEGEFLVIKFNQYSTEFIFRLDDVLVKGDEYDDTFTNIKELVRKVNDKFPQERMFTIMKQINFVPYEGEYRSLKDLNSVSGLRMISVKLYGVDAKFEEELITLLHPNGGEEYGIESLFELSPVCILHPNCELNVKYS